MRTRARTIALTAGLAVTLGLWAASYFNFSYASGNGLRYLEVEAGAVLLHLYDGDAVSRRPSWGWLGYDGLDTWLLPRLSWSSDKLFIVVPLWIPALFLMIALTRRQPSGRPRTADGSPGCGRPAR